MPKLRSLVVVFTVALVALLVRGAAAAPDSDGVIRQEHLKPYFKELKGQVELVKERKKPLAGLIDDLAARAASAKNKREKAIRSHVLGVALMEIMRRNKDAGVEFQRAIDLYPRFAPAHTRLAVLAFGAKESGRAKQHLERALELDPDYTVAITLLADMLAVEGKLKEARMLYLRAFSIEQSPQACLGLAKLYVRLYKEEFSAKKKEKHAREAIGYAKYYLSEQPKAGEAHLFLARIYRELGKRDEAIKALEESCRSQIPDEYKLEALWMLFSIHFQEKDLKRATTYLKRMLEHPSLEDKAREEIEKKIADLERKGDLAVIEWRVRATMKILENPGITAIERRDAVRILLEFHSDPNLYRVGEFNKLRWEVFRTIIRSLLTAPPEVSVEILTWFQKEFKDPNLLRIVVHFVYPNDDDTRTPAVRLQAVRAIAEIGGVAALPTLYYCLRDEPGEVLREVERNLARICEVRSMVGGGLKPLTREQKKLARIAWRKYFLGEDGVARLLDALAALRKSMNMDAGFNRTQQTKPMADHIAWTILLDPDMPFEIWLPAYEFLRDYMAKHFRPVAERSRPVTPADRPAIVVAIEEWLNAEGAGAMPPVEEHGKSDEEKKTK